MLFQVTTPDVHIPDPDSVRAVTHSVIEQAVTDPETFWHNMLQQAIHFGLKVLAALLIYLIGVWLIRRVLKILDRIFQRKKTEQTLASFISSFASVMMTIIVIIISVGTLGVDTSSLAALLAAGGMAIGMALSGTVQNFAGGIMILAFKPFKIGDWISAQGFSGSVVEVSITNTKIKTIDNRIVVLPNGALSNGVIDNYSTLDVRRLDMVVSVAYGTDAAYCKQVILDILHSDKRILDSKTPDCADPFVALKTLNSSDISFAVRAFVLNKDFWDVQFMLNERIYTELPQKGIQFAYPHVDVTMLNPEKK